MPVDFNPSSSTNANYGTAMIGDTAVPETADAGDKDQVLLQGNVWAGEIQGGDPSSADSAPPSLQGADTSSADPKQAVTVLFGAVDSVTALLADVIKTNQKWKVSNQQSREVEMKDQLQAINESADKMVEAAKDQLIGAAVGFAVTCATSALSMGASIKSAKLTEEGGEANLEATNAETKSATKSLEAAAEKSDLQKLDTSKLKGFTEQDKLDALEQIEKHKEKANISSLKEKGEAQMKAVRLNARAGKYNTAAQAIGQMAGSAGGLVTSGFGLMAAEAQADGKRADGKAAEAEFQRSKLTDEINGAADMISKVVDTLRTLIELDNSATEKVATPV